MAFGTSVARYLLSRFHYHLIIFFIISKLSKNTSCRNGRSGTKVCYSFEHHHWTVSQLRLSERPASVSPALDIKFHSWSNCFCSSRSGLVESSRDSRVQSRKLMLFELQLSSPSLPTVKSFINNSKALTTNSKVLHWPSLVRFFIRFRVLSSLALIEEATMLDAIRTITVTVTESSHEDTRRAAENMRSSACVPRKTLCEGLSGDRRKQPKMRWSSWWDSNDLFSRKREGS